MSQYFGNYQLPSVEEIRASFPNKPSNHKICTYPTKREIKEVLDRVRDNLRYTYCPVPGSEESGWIWLVQDEGEWHTWIAANGTGGENTPKPKADKPNLYAENVSSDDKKDERFLFRYQNLYAENVSTDDKKVELFLFRYKNIVERACLLDLREAIPSQVALDGGIQEPIWGSIQGEMELHKVFACLTTIDVPDAYPALTKEEEKYVKKAFRSLSSEEKEPTIKCLCEARVKNADDKIEKNIQSLEMFITVDTFFGGVLLFGLTGIKPEINTFTYWERMIIQLQIITFFLYTGAIFSAFVVIVFTKHSSWTHYNIYTTMGNRLKGVYENGEIFERRNPDHINLLRKAHEENTRRDIFRKWSKFFPFIFMLLAGIMLLVVVLWGATVQLGEDDSDDIVDKLQDWVYVVSFCCAAIPPAITGYMVLAFTRRFYF